MAPAGRGFVATGGVSSQRNGGRQPRLIHGVVTFIGLQGDGLRERMLRSEVERLRQRGGA